jgi:integrase/recombinase XerD
VLRGTGERAAQHSRALGRRRFVETICSSALRIRELVRLDVPDVDLAQRVLLTRQGKGKKDRIVPLGRLAARFIERYIREARVATRSHA